MTAQAPSESAGLRSPTSAQLLSRLAAAVLGTYAWGWGFIALGTALGSRLMPLGEARTLAHLLVFLLLLVGFCWAFAARSVTRVWALLVGSGAVMTIGAWLLMRGAA